LAVKLLYYFVFIFVGILLFLLYQKPYFIPTNPNRGHIASLEAYDVVNYSINQNGIYSLAKSSKIFRFNDHDEFYDIDVIRKKDDGVIDNLKARKGILKQNDLNVIGDVRYQDSNGVKFSSDEAKYNLKSKIFKSDTNFILKNNSTIIYGNSLVYQSKDGKIYAKNIKSISEVNKK
jgi:LPS export ABC transporter protein LptC